jgi:ferritin-like metal-binding protein YciE
MNMKLNNLQDVFKHELKDLYSAEKQLAKALDKLQKNAHSDTLKQAFKDHLQETEQHVQRLEELGSMLDIKLGGHRCEAMEGLIAEAEDILQTDASPEARDAALIAGAQRVEHYEIAAYGSACTFAELLGEESALRHLKETLREEEKTDKLLTQIATREVNQAALA